MATPCDGVKECLDNRDEENCGDKLEVVLLLIGITFSASLVVSGNVFIIYLLTLIETTFAFFILISNGLSMHKVQEVKGQLIGPRFCKWT